MEQAAAQPLLPPLVRAAQQEVQEAAAAQAGQEVQAATAATATPQLVPATALEAVAAQQLHGWMMMMMTLTMTMISRMQWVAAAALVAAAGATAAAAAAGRAPVLTGLLAWSSPFARCPRTAPCAQWQQCLWSAPWVGRPAVAMGSRWAAGEPVGQAVRLQLAVRPALGVVQSAMLGGRQWMLAVVVMSGTDASGLCSSCLLLQGTAVARQLSGTSGW